jgi:hypothetical protein
MPFPYQFLTGVASAATMFLIICMLGFMIR